MPKLTKGKWETIKRRVGKARVRLVKKGGQGILVPGGYILSAAHCVTWDAKGGMPVGDFYFETIQTWDGRQFKAEVCAVEGKTDIAVLSAPDDQVLPQEFMAFKAFCWTTKPIPLSTRVPDIEEWLPVHILDHAGKWNSGQATRFGYPGPPSAGTLCVQTKNPIRGGTSGSPIIDDMGHLVGIVSWSSENPHGGGGLPKVYLGAFPMPYLSLPRWVYDQVMPPEPTTVA